MLATNVVNGEVWCRPESYFAMGDNRDIRWTAATGLRPPGNIIGKPLHHLLVLHASNREPGQFLRQQPRQPLPGPAGISLPKRAGDRTFRLIHGITTTTKPAQPEPPRREGIPWPNGPITILVLAVRNLHHRAAFVIPADP